MNVRTFVSERNIKKRLSRRKQTEGVKVEREGRNGVEWLLIRVNDVENPPIRTFSCVAG